MQHRTSTVVTAAAAAVTTVLCAAGTAAAASGKHPRGPRISVTTTTCAPRWRPPNPGRDHFRIANDSKYVGTVYLLRPIRNKVVTTVKHLGPHTVHELTVRIVPGAVYQWGCDLAGRPPHNSDSEKALRDRTHGGPGAAVVPVTRDQLRPAMQTYRAQVSALLATLSSQVTTLGSDLQHGDTTAAEGQWLTAHLTWLAVGQDDGAYGVFGSRALAIDGTAAGLPNGTADPKFRGFHKIELDLFTHHDDVAAAIDTAALAKAVSSLAATSITTWLPLSTASVGVLPLRTHEVLEDALRDTLSGDDNYGSGTSLASVREDVTATQRLLTLYAPLIDSRSPHLVHRARKALQRLAGSLAASDVSGRWTPLADLTRHSRELIDAEVGDALETLAPVPDLLAIGDS